LVPRRVGNGERTIRYQHAGRGPKLVGWLLILIIVLAIIGGVAVIRAVL